MLEISKELGLLSDYLTLKNYSPATHKSYLNCLRRFLEWRVRNGIVSVLDQVQARNYLLHRYRSDLKWRTVNCDYSSLCLYYRLVKGLEWDILFLPRPKGRKELIRVLSQKQVYRIICAASNLKHQAFICLLYGTGVRLSEALNLRLEDIDGGACRMLIVQGKGGKDRYVSMPSCLLLLLRHYYRVYRPLAYLFNGRLSGARFSARSCQNLVKLAARRAGIVQNVSPHLFRHCYATHHLENGTNLIYIQKQLGHSNIKTTSQYLHLINSESCVVRHPLASMELVYQKRT